MAAKPARNSSLDGRGGGGLGFFHMIKLRRVVAPPSTVIAGMHATWLAERPSMGGANKQTPNSGKHSTALVMAIACFEANMGRPRLPSLQKSDR